jgi:hypothetical protein
MTPNFIQRRQVTKLAVTLLLWESSPLYETYITMCSGANQDGDGGGVVTVVVTAIVW